MLEEMIVCVVAVNVSHKSLLVPLDALLLVCVGVGETVDGTSLATEETVKVGTDLVALTLLQVVALCAAGLWRVRQCTGTSRKGSKFEMMDSTTYLEEVGTLLAVTCSLVRFCSSKMTRRHREWPWQVGGKTERLVVKCGLRTWSRVTNVRD